MLLYEQQHSCGGNYLYHQFNNNLISSIHLHLSFEFFYVESGEITLQIGDKSYLVSSGDAALIFPNQLHSYSSPVNCCSYCCIFSMDYIYDFYNLVADKEADCPIFKLNDASVIAMMTDESCNIFQEKSALYSIVSQFLMNCPLHSRTQYEENLLNKVIGFVQEHFTEPITLKTVSEKTGYHYNYLSKLLHSQLNINFSELINHHRIELASQLLGSTDKTVTEISSQCGFNTIRSFNRNFLMLRGVTPQQYRKQYLKTK